MTCNSSTNSSIRIVLLSLIILISNCNGCDVMGSRACGERPSKEDQESDPVKYCVASRVYFECVHKKYRGCENKEKYEIAMESMIKGLRKRVDELLGFCSDKIEDYKFNIVWESAKKAVVPESVRQGGSSLSASVQSLSSSSSSDFCQISAIDSLCQTVIIRVKFNLSWNSANKRGWCQQMLTYFRCLKLRLDQCPQQEIQNHYQQHEHYLHAQINIHCPGGIYGCTRHSPDARCTIGSPQSNSNRSKYRLSFLVVHSVFLQIVWFFVE